MAGHILLAGYLGSGNLGDDAVMLGFVNGLGSAGYDISVLSGAPEETHRLYGFRSYPRRDFKQIAEAIEACDAVVFPGGSIFQDSTSVKSVAYYAQIIKMAKKAGKKVVLVGQGIGPLNSFFGKRMAAGALCMADGIAVRDPGSLQALRDLGVNVNTRVTADSAFLLPMPANTEDSEAFNVGSMKTVGLAPRPVDKKGIDVAGLFGEFSRLLYQAGWVPVLVAMDKEEDTPLIQEISKRQGGKVPDLRKLTTPMQVQQRISRMDSVIAMRLHAGILAASVDVPPLMINYDPKVAAFAKLLDLGGSVNMEGLTAPRLLDSFSAFFKDRERNAKLIQKKREEMVKAAEGNIELVKQLVR